MNSSAVRPTVGGLISRLPARRDQLPTGGGNRAGAAAGVWGGGGGGGGWLWDEGVRQNAIIVRLPTRHH